MKIYGPGFRPSGLVLAAAMLVPHFTGAQTVRPATAQAASLTAVAQVGVDRVGQQTIVRVQGDGPLTYHVTQLSNPARVVVDFDAARLTASHNTVGSEFEPVRRVRLGQSQPDQVRVVIDLASAAQFKVEKKDQAVLVAFNDAPQNAGADSAASAAKPSKQDHAEAVKLQGSRQRFGLPATLSGNAALASPSPQTINPATVNPATLLNGVSNSTQVSVKPAVADGSQPAVAQPVASQPAAAPAAPAVKGYTGEAVSVNLKDVDLKDFFRLIHEISGLNVVLDPSVRGNVTLVLDEVPWDQALDIVLRNNGLSKELDGNVLRIATHDTLKREADDERDLHRAETEAVDPITVTRILSYAKAS